MPLTHSFAAAQAPAVGVLQTFAPTPKLASVTQVRPASQSAFTEQGCSTSDRQLPLQMPLAQLPPPPHACPVAVLQVWPEPHALPAEQELSVKAVGTLTHVPALPPGGAQVWQVPLHAVLQQTPSGAQKPPAHWLAWLQVWPRSSLQVLVVPSHACPIGQSESSTHCTQVFVAGLHTKPEAQSPATAQLVLQMSPAPLHA